jgi:hypothetical protein
MQESFGEARGIRSGVGWPQEQHEVAMLGANGFLNRFSLMRFI